MVIADIQNILEAELLCGEDLLDEEVLSACGCDLMSDVLAFVKEQSVLLTGLMNPQVVRTADMMDMRCIVFVRGKKPDDAVVELARSRDIAVMCTPLRMYNACGRLYDAGLQKNT